MRLGALWTISAFTVHTWKVNFFQGAMDVELWKEGAIQNTVKVINHLGMSQSAPAAWRKVDVLTTGFDESLNKRIDSIQVSIYDLFWHFVMIY